MTNALRIEIRRMVGAEDLPLPRYASAGAAGMDLHAAVPAPVTIPPLGRALIPTGVSVAIPEGYEGQVRPRSGLAARSGVTMLNAPGTIDSDYRGEISAVVVNLGEAPVTIARGDRIAQLIIAPVARVTWQSVDVLEDTERGPGGFGHTGK